MALEDKAAIRELDKLFKSIDEMDALVTRHRMDPTKYEKPDFDRWYSRLISRCSRPAMINNLNKEIAEKADRILSKAFRYTRCWSTLFEGDRVKYERLGKKVKKVMNNLPALEARYGIKIDENPIRMKERLVTELSNLERVQKKGEKISIGFDEDRRTLFYRLTTE